MCLEGRVPALLVALASVIMSACSGDRPAPVIEPRAAAFSSSSSPIQVPSATTAAADVARQAAGARVSVTLATPDRRKLINGAVIMTSDADRGPAAGETGDVMIFPDGSFTFSHVPPGSYQIRGRAETDAGGAPLFALYRIVVADHDLTVRLTLLPGASVSGRVSADGVRTARPATFAGLRIQAPLADGSSFGDWPAGETLADGSFTIRGVISGSHVITVAGLPDPWVVKRVTYRGQDITDAGLEADSGQRLADVRVTITDVASEVTGTVRDAEGQGVAAAMVLIIPAAPQFWTRVSRRFGRTSTDAEGRYRYRGLPPGEYRVVASTLDERDVYRRDLLRQLSGAGVMLRLDALATRAIDLRITPMATSRRTSAY
jgi:hypothetical protein